MVILVNGKIIKNRERDVISIRMDKNMMANGLEIKNLEMVPINIKMETFILVPGRMIEDQVKEK